MLDYYRMGPCSTMGPCSQRQWTALRRKEIRAEVAAEVGELKKKGITPGLAVVMVADPRSVACVAAKSKACEEAGIHSVTI